MSSTLARTENRNSQAPNHTRKTKIWGGGGSTSSKERVGWIDPRPERKLVVGNSGPTMNGYRRLHFPMNVKVLSSRESNVVFEAIIRENRQLVTNEPVEFEK